MRYSTVLQRGGMFRNQPEIVKSLLDKQVPLALAMQSFNSYSATQAKQTAKHLSTAGFSSTNEENAARPGYLNKTDEWGEADKKLANADNDFGGGLLGGLASGFDAFARGFTNVGSKVIEGTTWAWNRSVGAPFAAGSSSDSAVDDALQGANDWVDRIPVAGALASLGLGAVEGAANWVEGLGRVYAPGSVSDEQQRQDMRAAHLDPSRIGDRINFYSQDFGEVVAPISNEHIEKIKGLKRWSPEDVDAAREIIVSGAMDDLSRSYSALSPEAQGLIARASKSPNVEDLLNAVGDGSQNTLGWGVLKGFVPDQYQKPGQFWEPGSVSRQVASAATELIVTWHMDPTVVASQGVKAVRAMRYGVGGVAAEKIDNTIQMLKASDDLHAPKGALARRFDEAMQTADDIVTVGVSTPEAAKARASWIRRFPGYDKTLDLLIGQRAGTVGPIRARTLNEAKGEVKHAAEGGRDVNPWVLDASADGKPMWAFTKTDGTKATPEERALARANAAEELSTFIVMDAYASGREITGSRLLLPGQLSLNGKVRDKLAPVLEAFNRRDMSVIKQLKETGKKPIDLNGHVLADEQGRWDHLVNPESAEWLRNNYTFGITHMFSRGWRNFEKTFSNKTILPSSPDSVKVYKELVSQFMPKRQAQMVTTQYAAANPAERWVMTRQTIGSLLNVMNLRNTPEAQKIVDQLTKGLVPQGEYINGYKAGVREHYTTPDGNYIRVGDLKMPAAVHPWQLSEGVELPNWRELRGLANRNAVLNAVTRTADGQAANAMVRAWKASKVTTYSNMMRQGLELELFNAWREPGVLGAHRAARKAVKADVLNRKVNDHDLERLANAVNNFTPDDLAQLEVTRRSKPETYVKTISAILERDGISPRMAETMARLGQDVDLTEYGEFLASKSERRARHLAAIGPWDKVRRARAIRHERKGGNVEDTPLSKHLDAEMAQQMLEGAAKQFGSAADAYAWNMAERATHTDRARITDAAGRNISFRPVKVVNAYEWGDTTPALWAAELGRRQSDPIGELAMQFIAKRALADVTEAARPKVQGEVAVNVAQNIADELTATMRAKRYPELDVHALALSKNLDDAEALAGMRDAYSRMATDSLLKQSTFADADALIAKLYGEHELGASMRANSAGMQYLPDGKPVRNPADRQAAAQAAARRAVDDLVHHMGGKVTRTDKGAEIRFPEESRPLLEKLAKGEEISADDLAKLDDAAKPEGMVAPIYAPMVPEKNGFAQGLSNLATRAYGTVVADPLDKLFVMPTFVANRRLAQDEMAPLMEALTAKGMEPGQAAFMVEAATNKRAVAKTFQGTDNPMEKSVFSEMADKWLMFQRAQEDFLRRLVNATRANPEGLARANILMQAGVHAGIVHYEPFQDEEGNTEYHLTFTYPGTALAQRVMADAAAGLGLAPDEILRVPQFDGLKSQVRFINPGLSNPLQFSANPMFGFATWGAEKIWPGATVDLERLRRGLSGGEDFEGTSGPFTWKNLVPSMFTRFTTFASKDDADGQFQSAMRASLMYAELAGQTPGPDASPSERARYLDAVKATTTNIMIQRAVLGLFAPASPQVADPDETELDAIARAQGLPNLRAEFFDIRNELAKKYPDNFSRADSEAVAEFARRYPGELIVNPGAFSTSSTEIAGNDQAYAPYTIGATQWMFENLDFVRANPTLAFALMPKDTADGDFSNEAYKLQFKSDIRTHKDIQEFYDDLSVSSDIDEYYSTRTTFFNAVADSPALQKSIYAKMDDWESGWRRAHPLADQELNRRASPDYVHDVIAPAVGRVVDGTDVLPDSVRKLLPAIKEMWQDYSGYRDQYAKLDYYDNEGRRRLNKQYQQQGDLKWLGASQKGLDFEERNALNAQGGSLSGLWDLMRVSEGR